jgi:hypothetical protein
MRRGEPLGAAGKAEGLMNDKARMLLTQQGVKVGRQQFADTFLGKPDPALQAVDQSKFKIMMMATAGEMRAGTCAIALVPAFP